VQSYAKAEQIPNPIVEKMVVYLGYSSDSVQTISAFFLTIIAALSLPFFRTRLDVGIPMVTVLVGLMLVVIYFFDMVDPYKWAAKRIWKYSWASIAGILLNVLIIMCQI
jgi:hypothetical protein